MRRPLRVAAILAGLGGAGCHARSPDAQPSLRALRTATDDSYVSRCSASRGWLRVPPRLTSDVVYGVGTAQSDAAALEVARADAAKTISVDVRERMTDIQLLNTQHGAGASIDSSREAISRAASSSVEQRLEQCERRDQCIDDQHAWHVLVACARHSALERALMNAAQTILASGAEVGPLLCVPGSNSHGYVTQLGQYAVNVVRDSLLTAPRDAAGSYRVVAAPPWEPSNLQEAARKAEATHLLRVEYMALQTPRVRFSVYVQEAATDRHVPGTDVTFEIDLEPSQLVLLAIEGPLLPQKGAQDLVNTAGSYQLPLRLSKSDLLEGDDVSIELTLPREGYVYIYDIYEDGRAELLLPSPLSPNNRFSGNTSVHVPDAAWRKAGMTLHACPRMRQRVTREYVKAILSPVPLELAGAKVSGDTFTTLPQNGEVSVAVLQRQLARLQRSGVAIGTAEAPYFIRAAAQPSAVCERE